MFFYLGPSELIFSFHFMQIFRKDINFMNTWDFSSQIFYAFGPKFRNKVESGYKPFEALYVNMLRRRDKVKNFIHLKSRLQL